jgi:hypothetical protein
MLALAASSAAREARPVKPAQRLDRVGIGARMPPARAFELAQRADGGGCRSVQPSALERRNAFFISPRHAADEANRLPAPRMKARSGRVG